MKIGYNFLEALSSSDFFFIKFFIESYSSYSHTIFKNKRNRQAIECAAYSKNIFDSLQNTPKSLIRSEINLPFAIDSSKVDIFFSPINSMPLRQPSKTIALADKNLTPGNLFYSFIKNAAAKKTNRIIVKSKAEKKRLSNALQYDPARIFSIDIPPDPIFSPVFNEDTILKIKTKYSIGSQYFICAGTHNGKDIHELIGIFNSFSFSHNSPSLVIANKTSDPYLSELCRGCKKSKIVYIEKIGPSDLSLLYNGAAAFLNIFNKTYIEEALEALFCGTPIVSLGNEFINETAGNAAIISENNEKLLNSMGLVLNDANHRFKLHALSIERSKSFSLDKAAKALNRAFEEVFNESRLPDG